MTTTYTITTSDGKLERVTAGTVGLQPNGALLLGDDPQQFKVMYAPGAWTKIEIAAIQNAN